ncbi:CENP-Q, a CENPA-CAD centromere complex subunit domain containing protein [Rhypophila sp. PSN 637]
MPPEAPNQKRKRGRPSIASKNNESASGRVTQTSTTNHDDDSQSQSQTTRNNTSGSMEDSTAPKKRGRPRKSTDVPPVDDALSVKDTGRSESGPQEEDGSSNPRKRGRRGKTQNTAPEVENAPPVKEKGMSESGAQEDEASSNPRKRGRPTRSQQTAPEVEDAPPATQTVISQSETLVDEGNSSPKKRGRRTRSQPTVPEVEDAQPVKEKGMGQSGTREDEGSSNAAKKRGRPNKSQNTVPEVQDAPADTQTQKRRRPATEAQDDENEPPAKVRKTGKAAAAVAAKAPPETAESWTTTARRSTRDRRSADSNPYWSRNSGTASPEANRTNRSGGVGRSSLREVSVAESQNRPSPEVTNQAKKKRGPGRPSLDSTAEGSSSKPAGKTSRKEASQEGSTTAAKKSKDAPRKSDEPTTASTTKERATKAGSKKKTPQDPVPEPVPNRQRRSGGSRSSAADGASEGQHGNQESTNKTPSQPKPRPNARVKPEVPKYRHLAPKTRQIPRSTIAAKWTPLDEGSISVVDSIISDASRAVLHRLRDREKHREQAETVLNAFARRLHSKLVKGIPFPPASRTAGSSAAASAGSHEAELDFDRVMGAIKAVEGTLDPLSHSVALLTREKEKEEAALEADYKKLRKLKSNMRDETKKWIEHAKREHPLVPERQNVELVGGDFDEKDLLGQVRCVTVSGLELVKRRPAGEGEKPGGVFRDIPSDDEELTALAQRIGRHMNSMKSNLAQIDGVLPAINKSKASLQGVLYSYLDPELYEEVLFGKKEKKGAVET